MMGVAPAVRPITPGKRTSAVAQDQGAADADGHGVADPSDIQRLRLRTEHGGDEFAVTGQASRRGGIKGAGAVQQRLPQPLAQRLKGGHDQQVGFLPGLGG
jgi:hypothetical protein